MNGIDNQAMDIDLSDIHTQEDDDSDDDSIVVLDVGGRKFKTWRSTLQRIPNTRLAMLNHESKYYNRETGEYFFDRSADCFEYILNFYRTGELHVPFSQCGWSVKLELDFWGINWTDVKRCCWIHFNQTINNKTTLETFDRRVNKPFPDQVTMCNKIWLILDYPASTKPAMVYSILSNLVILASVVIMVVSSYASMRRNPADDELAEFYGINVTQLVANRTKYPLPPGITFRTNKVLIAEYVCLTFFAVEFILRFGSCPNKQRFIVFPLNIIDFFAIVPPIILGIMILAVPNLRFNSTFQRCFRAFEVIRVFRLFRIMRNYRAFRVIMFSLKRALPEIVLLLVVLWIGVIIFGCLIYYAEDQSRFADIFVGMWWALVTITTVGYGDLYPITSFGYCVGSLCAVTSILALSISVTGIVNTFSLYYEHSQTETNAAEVIDREQRERSPYILYLMDV
ncbi:potassium voltage-gated channel protein Shaw-like [Tubulanus polymorphus]|uniref:potassium voltage-gated channel protein Shaw-like n=1 Tax=Tubulanus polymorphus TaxID=672921 RepID=UPI003DA21A51